jgi:ribosomal protein S18 acetylase RimI-like enzyme
MSGNIKNKEVFTEIVYKAIEDKIERRKICDKVLHSLPDWFGIESAILDYIKGVGEGVFISAYIDGKSVGFASMHETSVYADEIYVMGILKENHRMGIGRRMIEICSEECRKNEKMFLLVKTISERLDDPFYKNTREFYKAAGFLELEELPTLWGENNPCLNMIKLI